MHPHELFESQFFGRAYPRVHLHPYLDETEGVGLVEIVSVPEPHGIDERTRLLLIAVPGELVWTSLSALRRISASAISCPILGCWMMASRPESLFFAYP